MAESKIKKNQIPKFLTAVSGDYTLYGPKIEDNTVVFGSINSAEEMMLEYRNSVTSPKELFLPRAEVVYEFDGENFVNDAIPDQKRVIFGIRPCDCQALSILDRIFDTEQIKDPFYVTRRQNTVIVALGCNQPLSSCFCTAVGGDPFSEEGADVLLVDIGDSFHAKAVTPKGKDFIAHYSKFFSTGAGGNWDKQAKQARDKIKSKLNIKDIKSPLKDRFEDNIWDTISQACIGCGTCSYLCPSCYCFDLVDEKSSAGMKKVRTWDCCMFSLFTRHASGHNPRPIGAARLRQRIMHKFSYYPERYGVNSCVGCGRCVRSCPVNLDIRQLLEKVTTAPLNTTTEK
jgi:ferredoxin